MAGPKLPYTLASENACRRALHSGNTFWKIDDPQFLLLRVPILIRKISAVEACGGKGS
jgi:hypothetical protein